MVSHSSRRVSGRVQYPVQEAPDRRRRISEVHGGKGHGYDDYDDDDYDTDVGRDVCRGGGGYGRESDHDDIGGRRVGGGGGGRWYGVVVVSHAFIE